MVVSVGAGCPESTKYISHPVVGIPEVVQLTVAVVVPIVGVGTVTAVGL